VRTFGNYNDTFPSVTITITHFCQGPKGRSWRFILLSTLFSNNNKIYYYPFKWYGRV